MSSVAAAQVAQYGIENKFIQGGPSTTYFKAVYKRHTNFSVQPMKVKFDTDVSLGTVNTITIPRNGDLIKEITIRMELPEILPVSVTSGGSTYNPVWTNSTPEAIVEKAELVIGGQTIQELTGEMSFIKSELETTESQYEALQKITNRYMNTIQPVTNGNRFENQINEGTVFMEMRFYFHKHPSLAIPLLALGKQEVEVRLTLRPLLSLFNSYNSSGGSGNTNIIAQIDTDAMEPIVFTPFVEYIFLDDMERKQFESGKQHDYLIEQTQFFQPSDTAGIAQTVRFMLPFRHLIKELFMVFIQENRYDQNTYTGNQFFWWGAASFLKDVELTFNGETRLTKEIGTAKYMTIYQPMNYHTRVPAAGDPSYPLNTYSFATEPESTEPTGAANFNRISKVLMTLNTLSSISREREIHIHATSWNILRICDHVADLVFK